MLYFILSIKSFFSEDERFESRYLSKSFKSSIILKMVQVFSLCFGANTVSLLHG